MAESCFQTAGVVAQWVGDPCPVDDTRRHVAGGCVAIVKAPRITAACHHDPDSRHCVTHDRAWNGEGTICPAVTDMVERAGGAGVLVGDNIVASAGWCAPSDVLREALPDDIPMPTNLGSYQPDSGLRDSGDRTEQWGGAVRDRATGKGRYDLLSPFAMRELAVHAEAGAVKYSERNFEKGYSLKILLDSAMRHLNDLASGDNSENHAIAAAWNMLTFAHMRHLIKEGLLPEHLAEGFVPMHITNPVTGRPDPYQ